MNELLSLLIVQKDRHTHKTEKRVKRKQRINENVKQTKKMRVVSL